MKPILLLFIAFLLGSSCFSQVYMTRAGRIRFYSSTAKENINAINNQVYAVVDAGKKNLAFTLLMKSFQFDKELMQEHFNENYAESDKYPKASFSGTYSGETDVSKEGIYHVIVKGNLTVHNVTKPVEIPATIEMKNNTLTGKATFAVKPEDYNITIPSLVREKIAKEITTDVLISCTPK